MLLIDKTYIQTASRHWLLIVSILEFGVGISFNVAKFLIALKNSKIKKLPLLHPLFDVVHRKLVTILKKNQVY